MTHVLEEGILQKEAKKYLENTLLDFSLLAIMPMNWSFHKNPKGQSSESFQIAEQVEVPGGWHLRGHGSTTPHSVQLSICIICNIFCNKLITVSVLLSSGSHLNKLIKSAVFCMQMSRFIAGWSEHS
jgi:hypothetical protein